MHAKFHDSSTSGSPDILLTNVKGGNYKCYYSRFPPTNSEVSLFKAALGP